MNAADIIVIGAGGHAKVLVAALERAGHNVAGLTDADLRLHDTAVLGRPVLGGDEAVLERGPGAVLLVNGIGSVRRGDLRARIQSDLAGRGFRFLTLVDPWALVGPDVVLGEGAQVLAGAVVQPGCRIGTGAIVNSRAAVDHDCVIGEFAHIAPGATLSGGVRVGARALVGTGAAVRQGISIGEGTVIGTGAAVVCDLPDGIVATGVPARVRERQGK